MHGQPFLFTTSFRKKVFSDIIAKDLFLPSFKEAWSTSPTVVQFSVEAISLFLLTLSWMSVPSPPPPPHIPEYLEHWVTLTEREVKVTHGQRQIIFYASFLKCHLRKINEFTPEPNHGGAINCAEILTRFAKSNKTTVLSLTNFSKNHYCVCYFSYQTSSNYGHFLGWFVFLHVCSVM